MNGTLFLRRSASMLLASSFLAIAACSVEFNGLLTDDAGGDGEAPPTRDASPVDVRAPDVRPETAADSTSTEGGGDATRDAALDGDATRDAGLDGGASRDAALDGDATREASLDGDRARDVASEPQPDASPQDTGTEASFDATIDRAVDAEEDAPADAGEDRPEVGPPPGTCGDGCNNIALIGQTVTRTVVSGPPPAMTGGTIVDGTYVAVAVVHYNDDSTPYSISETSIIAGNVDAWVSSINGQAPGRFTTTYTASGNQMIFAVCCPTVGNFAIAYTTDGVILSHLDPGNFNRVLYFMRQ